MGRLRDLLDELRAREVAVRLTADTRAADRWDGEGGAVGVAPPEEDHLPDDSASSRPGRHD